jgi:hypothetical protein
MIHAALHTPASEVAGTVQLTPVQEEDPALLQHARRGSAPFQRPPRINFLLGACTVCQTALIRHST